MESDNQTTNASQDDCIVLALSPLHSVPSSGTETGAQQTPKVRLSKAEMAQRKSEREAKKAEEEAARAEKKRIQEELKAKKAEELRLEKARKAEELQQEKVRRAEEKARKAEELQQEKARKAEELQQEKARKAEELQQEKIRKAEEKARKEAEYASKKAELMQKKEQKQAAAQKQELLQKQMANTMNKYFKPIEKSGQKDTQTSTTNNNNIVQVCTNDFDNFVSKQDVSFISDIIENLTSMKRIDVENNTRSRLNSDSNSCPIFVSAATTTTTTMNNPYVLKTRYIHFPEKYFNRPPYYGTLKKAMTANANPLQPTSSIDNIDYAVDSEGEWEEPCKDGEELRSDAEDLSDAESMNSDSDTDSFIVPHGHLSDDELNEDEQQQSTLTKQAREAAKSHVWDKKVARLNQQRELKPIFGCIHDSTLDEKVKFELSNYLHQFQRILVPKEICQKVEQEEKEQEINEESAPNGEKQKRVSKKKSAASKKGATAEQQQQQQISIIPSTVTPTAKRISSVSILVESASPSKRRKVNSNENCSMIDDTDVIMVDTEAINNSKTNVLEDASNVTEIKSSPLTMISNEDMKLDSTPICTLLIPKRKQPPV